MSQLLKSFFFYIILRLNIFDELVRYSFEIWTFSSTSIVSRYCILIVQFTTIWFFKSCQKKQMMIVSLSCLNFVVMKYYGCQGNIFEIFIRTGFKIYPKLSVLFVSSSTIAVLIVMLALKTFEQSRIVGGGTTWILFCCCTPKPFFFCLCF